MIDDSKRTLTSWPAIVVAMVFVTIAYWPGLAGSFEFDDSTFLIANNAIKVVNPGFAEWVAAAMSFPAGSHQGRWLGMLSFAANHYFTGMDPYWFKLTNLLIHLTNGFLLYLALRALFDFYHACCNPDARKPRFNSGLAAAAIAALWLALPINLTGVLYISQRLESLSNTWVFLGLWWYVRARLAHWQGRKGSIGMWLALLVCTGLGVMVKESAILLPLYAASLEFALTAGRNRDGQWSRPVLNLYGTLLALPLIGGLVWLGGWIGGPRSYGRAFNIPERLMTEGRVLVDYMAWILVPSLDSLTLHHDDVSISRGLLDPPTTLAALVAIGGLLAAALWFRSRRPLFALGLFWFFGGHLLTATVIPLLLVFEHRNYFPSVGLLLAVASLLVLELPQARTRAVALGVVCLFAFYTFTTGLRALEWSSSLQLAATDAAKRPNSSAAQYEYARALLGSTLNGDSEPMRRKAYDVLEPMAANTAADAVHNQLLIVTSAKHGLPIKSEWWDALVAKLKSHPPTSMDASALVELLRCYDDRVCPLDIERLRDAFAAAADHPGGYAPMLAAHGQFALDYLHDIPLAERQYRAALEQSPTDPISSANMVVFLARVGRIAEAHDALEQVKTLNYFGSLDARIAQLEEMLVLAQADTDRRKNGPSPNAQSKP